MCFFLFVSFSYGTLQSFHLCCVWHGIPMASARTSQRCNDALAMSHFCESMLCIPVWPSSHIYIIYRFAETYNPCVALCKRLSETRVLLMFYSCHIGRRGSTLLSVRPIASWLWIGDLRRNLLNPFLVFLLATWCHYQGEKSVPLSLRWPQSVWHSVLYVAILAPSDNQETSRYGDRQCHLLVTTNTNNWTSTLIAFLYLIFGPWALCSPYANE